MAWTPHTIVLLFVGWLVWLLWAVLGPLIWIPTTSDGWERVPKVLSLYGRAARRRVARIPNANLRPDVREVAILLEARERWLTWRLLSVVFSGLLTSFLPLTLITFSTMPTPDRGEQVGLALDRLPSALGVVAVAAVPLVVTAVALITFSSKISRSWPSDLAVWSCLHVLLRDEVRSGWRSQVLRRTRSLRNLAAAVERDFMRLAAVSDPSELHRQQRAVIGGVLDHHDKVVIQPSRAFNPERIGRFAGHWLAGDWQRLHRGTVRDHPTLPARESWSRRRGVVIAVIVVYVVLAVIVLLGNYDDREAWPSSIGILVTPLVIAVLEPAVRTWAEARRSRDVPPAGPPRPGPGAKDEPEE